MLPKLDIKLDLGNVKPIIPEIKINKEDKSKDTQETKDIKKILRKNGFDILSYSRLNNMDGCMYSYYLTYVLSREEKLKRGIVDRGNIYSTLGDIIHLCLEKFIKKEITREEMLSKFDFMINDAKTPKGNDTVGMMFPSEKVEKSYVSSLKLFLQSYNPPVADAILLETFLWKTFLNKIALQGYADLILGFISNGEKEAVIYDFKTSSMFSKTDFLEKGRQLVLYAMMYQERTGIPVKKVCWNMLKYVTVNSTDPIAQLNKMSASDMKEILKQNGIEDKMKKDEMKEYIIKNKIKIDYEISSTNYLRCDVGSKLASKIEKLLSFLGYDVERINVNIGKLMDTNNIMSMDNDIIDVLKFYGYDVNDCILEYPLTPEVLDEAENWVISNYHKLQKLPKIISDLDVNLYYPAKIEKFKCENLCGFAKDGDGNVVCPYYKERLQKEGFMLNVK